MPFQLDNALKSGASERKVRELEQALEDLNLSTFPTLKEGRESELITLSLPSASGVLFAYGEGDSAVEFRLLWSTIRTPLKEYQEMIEGIVRVGSMGGHGRYEAMDYGKKVVHDEAGELIQELLEVEMNIPLSTARRLFTLLFLLKTDLPGHLVQYHRSHF